MSSVYEGDKDLTYMGRAVVIAAPHQAYWTRPTKVPPKRAGRRGTRRAWKRLPSGHPRWTIHHGPKPGEVLMNRDVAIMTIATWIALRIAKAQPGPLQFSN